MTELVYTLIPRNEGIDHRIISHLFGTKNKFRDYCGFIGHMYLLPCHCLFCMETAKNGGRDEGGMEEGRGVGGWGRGQERGRMQPDLT